MPSPVLRWSERARAAYRGALLLSLARPLDDQEQRAAQRAARGLRRHLALDPPSAEREARRCLLLRRLLLVHEVMALQARVETLAGLLDGVEVRGLEHLQQVDGTRGVLLLSVHYGAYSSVLPLWLARSTARGLFRHLTLLFDSGPAGHLGMPECRARELEAAGLGCRALTELVDRRRVGSAWAARRVVQRLGAGGAALVFPDAVALGAEQGDEIQSRTSGVEGRESRRGLRALRVDLGRERVFLRRGAGWLARASGAALVPVFVRAEGESHTIVFGPPLAPGPEECAATVQYLVEGLFERTVLRDPGPWEGWLWLPEAEEAPAPARWVEGPGSPGRGSTWSRVDAVEGRESKVESFEVGSRSSVQE